MQRRALTTLVATARRCLFSPTPALPVIRHPTTTAIRSASSASSKRWLARQAKDYVSKDAKLKGLKSRAGAKLLEIHKAFGIFGPGMTVVDLGYAPGAWTQVAVEFTAPRGRVIGVDVIPALPPKGASTVQGDFTSPLIQASLRSFLSDPERGRPRKSLVLQGGGASGEDVDEADKGYIERERSMSVGKDGGGRRKEEGDTEGKDSVDVVLSDMCEPWPLVDGLWKMTLKMPYVRMMNVSGLVARDHVGSMELCHSALLFCMDVLKPGGAFVCKFYMGKEDKFLEAKLDRAFAKVSRVKPESSRPESKECYFVALKKRPGVDKMMIERMPITAETSEEPFIPLS